MWCKEAPLCTLFPSIDALAGSKGARVEDLWEPTWADGSWNFRLDKHLNDWEMEEIQGSIDTVSKKIIILGTADRIF